MRLISKRVSAPSPKVQWIPEANAPIARWLDQLGRLQVDVHEPVMGPRAAYRQFAGIMHRPPRCSAGCSYAVARIPLETCRG
jgi:hypothetical protein